MQNQEQHFSWINSKLHLKKSGIEGVGYSVQAPIKKDEKLIVQSGQCVHVSEIDSIDNALEWYVGFQIETDVYYCPLAVADTRYLDGIFFLNHSCSPNAGFSGQITLVAMRDIAVGEEITYDYAMTDIETDHEEPWKPESCLCQSDNCRQQITGSDWKLATVQSKYNGYFATHVANAIKAENNNRLK